MVLECGHICLTRRTGTCRTEICPYDLIGMDLILPASYRISDAPIGRETFGRGLVQCKILNQACRHNYRFTKGKLYNIFKHEIAYAALIDIEYHAAHPYRNLCSKTVALKQLFRDPNEILFFSELDDVDLKREGISICKRDRKRT